MKIHFDGANLDSTTGPNSFARRLSRRLLLSGHDLNLDQGADSDVSLIFIEPTGAPLAKKKVQRLDGIWSKAVDIEIKNARMKQLYHAADGVVFQSNYDMKYINSLWGQPAKTGLFSVINNGIELSSNEEFEPSLAFQSLRQEFDMIFVCSANWHRQKRLKENVECFRHLQTIYPTRNCCLIIMGSNPDEKASGRDIFYTGSIPHQQVLEVFKNSDWMINLEYFSHSPNAVVEALSVGCPVICMAAGGCAELVQGYGVQLASMEDVLPERGSMGTAVEYDKPPEITLHKAIRRLPERSDLGAHADIDIDHIAEKYVTFFDKIVRS